MLPATGDEGTPHFADGTPPDRLGNLTSEEQRPLSLTSLVRAAAERSPYSVQLQLPTDRPVPRRPRS